MDKILAINTIKNVFSALGAKTSDSNYGVALLDKTSGEPKGLMGMSDLASVLGVLRPVSMNATTDLNDIKYPCFGRWTLGAQTPQNAPTTLAGVVMVHTFDENVVLQVYVAAITTVDSYQRLYWYGEWYDWKKISYVG